MLAIEIVGGFLGIDTDEGLYAYFRRHYAAGWFPALSKVHRTTFARQAANLWAVKEMLWKHLLDRIRFDPELSLSTVPRCRYAASRGPTAAVLWPKNRPSGSTRWPKADLLRA